MKETPLDRKTTLREETYHMLFEMADQGFAILEVVRDGQGQVVDLIYREVNQAFERQVGLSNVLGKTVLEVMPDYDQSRFKIFQQVSDTGESRLTEFYLANLRRWFRAHYSRVGGEGSPFLASIFEDITKRKRLEEQLQRSNQNLNEILASIQDDFYVLDHDWNFVYVNRQFTSRTGKEPEDFIGNNIWEMFPKHVGTLYEENVRAVMEKREIRRFEIAGKYTNAWYILTVYPSAEGITILGTDITERKRQGELSHALNFVNASIHSTHDLNEIMQRAMDQAANALGCDSAAISLREGQAWVVKYVYRFSPDIIGAQMNGDEERHAVLAIQTKLPVVINDALKDERVNREHLRKWGIRSVLVVPLIIRDQARGVIFFNHQRSQTIFTDDQIDFAVKLSASLSLALHNAQLFEDLQTELAERLSAEETLRENDRRLQLLNETLEQKVQEKTTQVQYFASEAIKSTQRERQRVSQILHDDLQQRIYAIQIQMSFLRDGLQDEQIRQEASEIEGQLHEMLQMTRHLSIDLNPPILRGEGLRQAVTWLAKRMQEQYGLSVDVEADGSFAISNEELHVLLFNCIRELLFNVVKHAKTSSAVVTLRQANSVLQIEVCDKGQGFSISMPEEESIQSGTGLSTIRQQLSFFGGNMDIHSLPGAGTRIILSVGI